MLYGTNGSGIKGWYSQPSGGSGMTYPGAGVPNCTGSAWGTSYAVGTSANDLVQLNSSGQLPAVSGANLTGMTAAMVGAAPATTGTSILKGNGSAAQRRQFLIPIMLRSGITAIQLIYGMATISFPASLMSGRPLPGAT